MKEDVLLALLDKPGQPIAIDEMATGLGIPGAMVDEHVKTLQGEGYPIVSIPGRGYCLDWPPEEFNPALAEKLIKGRFGHPLFWYPETGSTHQVARQMLAEGNAVSGQVVIARRQSRGRGRRGREWVAPVGGLWFSLVLFTDLLLADIPKLSLLFSLAVVQALERRVENIGIKWPNDVLVGDRKLCGVLLTMEGTKQETTSLVVSIGININVPSSELPPEAISLYGLSGKYAAINEIFAEILWKMETLYGCFRGGDWDNILDSYRKHCRHLGREITVHQGDELLTGVNTDIGADGSLELQIGEKTTRLYSGDIVESWPGTQHYPSIPKADQENAE